MDRCPAELWSNIFALACTDTGFTGRSLSLVSKGVRDWSAEAKLQSVSVHGLAQLCAFAEVLANTPPEYRRVRHLCICDRPIKQGCLHTPEGRAVQSPVWTKRMIPMTTAECRMWREIAEKQAREAGQGRERFWGTLVTLLQLLSNTLQSLAIFVSFRKPFPLPVALPALIELTLYGNIPFTSPHVLIASFHNLRRLHLTGSRNWAEDIVNIGILAPKLTHLRISGLTSFDCSSAASAFGVDGALPGTLESVAIEPAVPFRTSCYDLVMTAVRNATRDDTRLVLRKPQVSQKCSIEGRFLAENEWLKGEEKW